MTADEASAEAIKEEPAPGSERASEVNTQEVVERAEHTSEKADEEILWEEHLAPASLPDYSVHKKVQSRDLAHSKSISLKQVTYQRVPGNLPRILKWLSPCH